MPEDKYWILINEKLMKRCQQGLIVNTLQGGLIYLDSLIPKWMTHFPRLYFNLSPPF